MVLSAIRQQKGYSVAGFGGESRVARPLEAVAGRRERGCTTKRQWTNAWANDGNGPTQTKVGNSVALSMTYGTIYKRKGSAFLWVRYRDRDGRIHRESTGTIDPREAEDFRAERLGFVNRVGPF